MYKKTALIMLAASLFVGCASVPMESREASNNAKAFNAPSAGNAGLYIYRDSGVGSALKKDIWVNGKCVGESAPQVFFYEEVPGDREHTLSTESEFSPNKLMLKTEAGKLYFIEQYIRMGVFVGGANLRVVSEAQGKRNISKLEMARKGKCS